MSERKSNAKKGRTSPAQRRAFHSSSGHDQLPDSLFAPMNDNSPSRASRSPAHLKDVDLKPQNAAQRFYIKALQQGETPYVVAYGPAGTGKTFIAVLHAINELRAGNISKVIITRPMVGSGEELGFLPGDVTDKVAPWCIPIFDAFEEFYGAVQVKKMIEAKIIEVAPLALMRGRTLKNALIVADEAQNCSCEQMKMLVTRLGHNSRMIITGDVEQHDRGFQKSGLADLLERIDAHEGLQRRTSLHGFTRSDCVRHEAIEDVLAAYAA